MKRLLLSVSLLIGLAGVVDAKTMRVIRCSPSLADCYYVDVPVRPQDEWDRLQELNGQIQELQRSYERQRQYNINRELYGR